MGFYDKNETIKLLDHKSRSVLTQSFLIILFIADLFKELETI